MPAKKFALSNLKKRLKAGEALHGCWLNTGSAISAEIVGSSGFDWVLIDLEHGAGRESAFLPQIQALGNSVADTWHDIPITIDTSGGTCHLSCTC